MPQAAIGSSASFGNRSTSTTRRLTGARTTAASDDGSAKIASVRWSVMRIQLAPELGLVEQELRAHVRRHRGRIVRHVQDDPRRIGHRVDPRRRPVARAAGPPRRSRHLPASVLRIVVFLRFREVLDHALPAETVEFRVELGLGGEEVQARRRGRSRSSSRARRSAARPRGRSPRTRPASSACRSVPPSSPAGSRRRTRRPPGSGSHRHPAARRRTSTS